MKISKQDKKRLAMGMNKISLGMSSRSSRNEKATLRHFKETTNDYIFQASKKVSTCGTSLKKLYKLW